MKEPFGMKCEMGEIGERQGGEEGVDEEEGRMEAEKAGRMREG